MSLQLGSAIVCPTAEDYVGRPRWSEVELPKVRMGSGCTNEDASAMRTLLQRGRFCRSLTPRRGEGHCTSQELRPRATTLWAADTRPTRKPRSPSQTESELGLFGGPKWT
ncbi:hypothetical protein Kisp01_71920 [Kineosporia sp. NBRC 101677]|nr:hypothetical protein Kisp01_71920 [Kineosporia sp. NBRC 101677]